MKYSVLFFLITAIGSPVWGADSVAFKCYTQIFDAKEFSSVSNNGVVDLAKIASLPHSINFASSFSFTKDGRANCAYTLQNAGGTNLESKTFNYPAAGDNQTLGQLQQKLVAFLIPLRFTGSLQYQKFISRQPLANILADYKKLPTPSSDKYLQFEKDDISNTTVVITDPAEENIIYRIVVPNATDDPSDLTPECGTD